MDRVNECFAGYRNLKVFDDRLNTSFPVIVMYPTDIPENEEILGPYYLRVSKESKPIDGAFPLVVISHGGGGTPLVYRTLARYLARNGYIVAMPEHPINNLKNNDWENTIQLLKSRPKNIIQTIHALEMDPFLNQSVDFDAISMIGHSMGGYSAVAAAGGIPTSLPWEKEDQKLEVIEVDIEPRIKKLVLLAPALGWFRNKGALDQMNLPVLMITGEKDEITPSFHAEILLNGVPQPDQIVHKTIQNAGHFSFLSPFPKIMKDPSFPPSQDPEGFNRELFHHELNAEISRFV